MIGQGHGLIQRRAGQARQEEGGHGEENGRRLAGGAQQSQDDAGDDAGQRLRQHDVADALPASAAQAGADGAELHGHGAQGLLGSADDDGQGHDGQGERAGQNGCAEAQEKHEQAQSE